MGKITRKKATSDVQTARGRLKGALQTIVDASDEESDSDLSDIKMQQSGRSRGRPPKKVTKISTSPTLSASKESTAQGATAVHESFVMKLFDRSLDLAKYDEHTPLYPICRAWLMNQPRSNAIKNYRNRRSPSPQIREKHNDLLKKIREGLVTDVTSLPAPKLLDIPRVPSPVQEQKDTNKDNVRIDYDIESPNLKTKDDLLDGHKKRWLKIRNKWNAHAKACQQKYILSYEILDAIYKPDE